MRNILMALGLLLLAAGALYMYNRRHENVKIQSLSSVGTNLQQVSSVQKAAVAQTWKNQQSQMDKMLSNPGR